MPGKLENIKEFMKLVYADKKYYVDPSEVAMKKVLANDNTFMHGFSFAPLYDFS